MSGLVISMATAEAGVEKQGYPRILRVAHLENAEYQGTSEPSLGTPQNFQFKDELNGRETFEIFWMSASAGSPAGTLVTFEFRRRFDDDIRFLSSKIPFPVKGPQVARFNIDRGEGGPVTEWRARIVLRGHLLAEQTSASWR